MSFRRVLLLAGVMSIVLVLTACGGGDTNGVSGGGAAVAASAEEVEAVSLGDPEAGKEHYDTVCIACHGPGGEGVEGLGKPFTSSGFLRENSDEELLAFIKVGRPTGDPLNTTGVDMPPKGGNPALTDEQILDIVAYLRTLQE